MSKLDVTRRFSRAMLGRNNAQAVSMPVLCGDEERLFFYYTTPVSEGSMLEEISAVWVRTVESGELTEKGPAEFFQEEELAAVYASQKACAAAGENALALTEQYYDAHEALYQMCKAGNAPDRDTLESYVQLLWKLVPESSLREAYRYIGRPLLQQLEAEP